MTDHEMKLAAARKRIAAMDEGEGQEERSLSALIAALDAGLSGTDDGPAYDALVMLMDIRSVVKNIPLINVASLKTLLIALDDGKRVSVKQNAAFLDPTQN